MDCLIRAFDNQGRELTVRRLTISSLDSDEIAFAIRQIQAHHVSAVRVVVDLAL